MAVGNGPDGKPLIAGYRQPLTGYYLKSAAVAVVALEGFEPDQRKALLEPSEGLEDTPPGAGAPDMLPAFLYVTRAMGTALAGGSLDSLKRGTTGGTIRGSIIFDSTRAPARNVVAVLKGSDPKLAGEYVAIGAHNDHIGFNHAPVDHDSLRAFDAVVRPQGEDDRDRPATAEEQTRIRQILDSLRKKNQPRLDSIYNGADDDGSGTVATLEIAEAFARGTTKPKRSILFVWHAGEEKGLWGSQYFTDHPTVPRDSIVAQLNMDMIGRGASYDIKGRRPDLPAADRVAPPLHRVGRPRGDREQDGADARSRSTISSTRTDIRSSTIAGATTTSTRDTGFRSRSSRPAATATTTR